MSLFGLAPRDRGATSSSGGGGGGGGAPARTSTSTSMSSTTTGRSSAFAAGGGGWFTFTLPSVFATPRRLHSWLAPLTALCLTYSLFTGWMYRWLRNAMGYSKADVGWWRDWHVGRFSAAAKSSDGVGAAAAGAATTSTETTTNEATSTETAPTDPANAPALSVNEQAPARRRLRQLYESADLATTSPPPSTTTTSETTATTATTTTTTSTATDNASILSITSSPPPPSPLPPLASTAFTLMASTPNSPPSIASLADRTAFAADAVDDITTTTPTTTSVAGLFSPGPVHLEAYYPIVAALLICAMIISGIIMSPLIRTFVAQVRKWCCCCCGGGGDGNNGDRTSNGSLRRSGRSSASLPPSLAAATFSGGAGADATTCSWLGSRFTAVTEAALRDWHRTLSLVLSLPLFLTTITGGVWTILRYWLPSYATKAQLSTLMYIHQGSYLGDPAIYTTLLFVGTLPLLFTGVRLVPIIRKLCPPHARTTSTAYTILAVNRAFASSHQYAASRSGDGSIAEYGRYQHVLGNDDDDLDAVPDARGGGGGGIARLAPFQFGGGGGGGGGGGALPGDDVSSSGESDLFDESSDTERAFPRT